MATRTRPAWDLSLSEINRRANELKVKNYLKREQQEVRADAAASSRVEHEILKEAAKAMTVDEVFAFSAAVRRGENPNIRDYTTARADSTVTTNGLRMITTKDHADRPIYTFELPAGGTKRTTWMAPYCAEPHLQIRINKKAGQPDSVGNAAFEVQWQADQRAIAEQLASGVFQFQEL